MTFPAINDHYYFYYYGIALHSTQYRTAVDGGSRQMMSPYRGRLISAGGTIVVLPKWRCGHPVQRYWIWVIHIVKVGIAVETGKL